MSLDTPLLIAGALVLLLSGLLLAYRWRRASIITVSTQLRASLASLPPDDEIRQLVASGNKIAAIKRVREQTGMGLKEAKAYVEALPGTLPRPAPTQAEPATTSPVEVTTEARRLLQQSGKLAAIKRVRELTGMDLAHAKAFVERL